MKNNVQVVLKNNVQVAPWDRVHICHLVPAGPIQQCQHWEGETLFILVIDIISIFIISWLFYHFDGTISYNSIDLYSQIIMIIIDCYSRTSITATELSYFLLIFSYHLIQIIIIEWYSEPPLPHLHHDIFSSNHHITISSWSWWSSAGIPEPPLPQLPLTLLQLRTTSLTPCHPTSETKNLLNLENQSIFLKSLNSPKTKNLLVLENQSVFLKSLNSPETQNLFNLKIRSICLKSPNIWDKKLIRSDNQSIYLKSPNIRDQKFINQFNQN